MVNSAERRAVFLDHYGAGPGCFSTRLRLKKPLQPTACVFVG
jgi:hypothetical protein